MLSYVIYRAHSFLQQNLIYSWSNLSVNFLALWKFLIALLLWPSCPLLWRHHRSHQGLLSSTDVWQEATTASWDSRVKVELPGRTISATEANSANNSKNVHAFALIFIFIANIFNLCWSLSTWFDIKTNSLLSWTELPKCGHCMWLYNIHVCTTVYVLWS